MLLDYALLNKKMLVNYISHPSSQNQIPALGEFEKNREKPESTR